MGVRPGYLVAPMRNAASAPAVESGQGWRGRPARYNSVSRTRRTPLFAWPRSTPREEALCRPFVGRLPGRFCSNLDGRARRLRWPEAGRIRLAGTRRRGMRAAGPTERWGSTRSGMVLHLLLSLAVAAAQVRSSGSCKSREFSAAVSLRPLQIREMQRS
jgi:hypothetical protein